MEPDLLTAVATANPNKVAVIDDRPGFEPRSITYGDYNRLVNRLAHGLIEAGVEPGDKVMWLGQNSIEVTAFSHAARKAAAISVPLNYRLTDDESVYVIDNSDSVVVYADVAYAELLDRIRDRIPTVRTVVTFPGPAPVDGDGRPVGLRPGQTAEIDFLSDDDSEPDLDQSESGTMIYTSGTTGNPKGAVRHEAASLEQRVGLLQTFGVTPDHVYVTCGPLYHSGPGGFAGIAFVLGQTVVVQHKFDPEDWLRLIDKYRCSSTFSAPTPIRMVVNLPQEVKDRYDVSCMKLMVANAAPWPFALKEAYVKDFPPESLWEVYGSTELGVNTVLAPADQLERPGSCGKPAPYVELALFDDDGAQVTESGRPGELFVRASSVFDTYYKAADKYAADDRGDGWHTVGDMAYFDDDGFYYICDRKKDMIISGGMNIYPAEVEAALEQHPGIFEVAVIGVDDEEWGESVVAVIVAHDADLDAAAVETYARTHLAGYKVPRRVEFVDEIPKTGSNKILKRELRDRFART